MDLRHCGAPSRSSAFSPLALASSYRSTPRFLDSSTPRRCRALAALALAPLLVLVGCRGELRSVTRSELLSAPPDTAVQAASATLPDGYGSALPAKRDWKAYASGGDGQPAIDDDPATALVAPAEHGNDLWLLVDLGSSTSIRAVRQIHGSSAGHPARYRIDVAGPKGFPWKLAWLGPGTPQASLAVFAQPVEARLLRITVLEEATPRWGVTELEVF